MDLWARNQWSGSAKHIHTCYLQWAWTLNGSPIRGQPGTWEAEHCPKTVARGSRFLIATIRQKIPIQPEPFVDISQEHHECVMRVANACRLCDATRSELPVMQMDLGNLADPSRCAAETKVR